eukprot:SAG31_NODE_2579_length_5438_cov_17.092527_5_plen_48_part_00
MLNVLEYVLNLVRTRVRHGVRPYMYLEPGPALPADGWVDTGGAVCVH